MTNPEVVVVGSVHLDLIARAERVPLPGEALLGSTYLLAPGGKGGNQAIAAAIQGARTAIVARVGADWFGDLLRERLASKSVDVRHLLSAPDTATGVCPILMSEDGGSATIIVPGAARTLNESHIADAEAILHNARVLMLQREIDVAASAAAARLARAAGAMVVFNPSPLDHAIAHHWADIWDVVDLLIVNAAEAGVLAGRRVSGPNEGLEAAESLRQRFKLGVVVVTLGDHGAAVSNHGDAWHQPAIHGPVIDTVGAGDAFAGAVAASLARGEQLSDAVLIGVAAGGLAVQREGAYDAAPTLAEARAYARLAPAKAARLSSGAASS